MRLLLVTGLTMRIIKRRKRHPVRRAVSDRSESDFDPFPAARFDDNGGNDRQHRKRERACPDETVGSQPGTFGQ